MSNSKVTKTSNFCKKCNNAKCKNCFEKVHERIKLRLQILTKNPIAFQFITVLVVFCYFFTDFRLLYINIKF